MKNSRIAWKELFKDLYTNKRLRISLFFGVGTYAYLIKIGFGPIFSLLILIPSSYLAALVFFIILENLIFPLYNWLTRGK